METNLLGPVLAIVVLILLDVIALRHGADSRTPFGRRDW